MKFSTASLLKSLVLASFLLKGVTSAGNEEDELMEIPGVTSETVDDRITYQCTYRNLWTKGRQPKNFPEEMAHIGGPILWTSTLEYQPWHDGAAVSLGVEQLAESGFTDVLKAEMDQVGTLVLQYQEYPGGKWFVKDKVFVHLPPITATAEFPHLSMMAAFQPSPDWYTGFYSYWLIDETSKVWFDHLKIQVKPWDAGTDAGKTYDALESDLDPPIFIERFVDGKGPEGGEFASPDGTKIPNVGELECFLVVGDQDIAMPECDWFANPCCNETDTQNCGALLPNGATPMLSPEYAEVLAGGSGSGAASIQGFSAMTAFVAGLAVIQWILA